MQPRDQISKETIEILSKEILSKEFISSKIISKQIKESILRYYDRKAENVKLAIKKIEKITSLLARAEADDDANVCLDLARIKIEKLLRRFSFEEKIAHQFKELLIHLAKMRPRNKLNSDKSSYICPISHENVKWFSYHTFALSTGYIYKKEALFEYFRTKMQFIDPVTGISLTQYEIDKIVKEKSELKKIEERQNELASERQRLAQNRALLTQADDQSLDRTHLIKKYFLLAVNNEDYTIRKQAINKLKEFNIPHFLLNKKSKTQYKTNVDLSGIYITGFFNLDKFNLRGANFADSVFSHDEKGRTCFHGDLTNANLKNARFLDLPGEGLCIKSTDFSYANLTNTDLTGIINFGLVNFTHTILIGAYRYTHDTKLTGESLENYFTNSNFFRPTQLRAIYSESLDNEAIQNVGYSWDSLPNEAFQHILFYLDRSSWIKLSLVSKFFFYMVKDVQELIQIKEIKENFGLSQAVINDFMDRQEYKNLKINWGHLHHSLKRIPPKKRAKLTVVDLFYLTGDLKNIEYGIQLQQSINGDNPLTSSDELNLIKYVLLSGKKIGLEKLRFFTSDNQGIHCKIVFDNFINFSHHDLSSLDLSNLHIKINFSHANLTNANLSHSIIYMGAFEQINLTKTKLIGTQFSEYDKPSAQINQSKMDIEEKVQRACWQTSCFLRRLSPNERDRLNRYRELLKNVTSIFQQKVIIYALLSSSISKDIKDKIVSSMQCETKKEALAELKKSINNDLATSDDFNSLEKAVIKPIMRNKFDWKEISKNLIKFEQYYIGYKKSIRESWVTEIDNEEDSWVLVSDTSQSQASHPQEKNVSETEKPINEIKPANLFAIGLFAKVKITSDASGDLISAKKLNNASSYNAFKN